MSTGTLVIRNSGTLAPRIVDDSGQAFIAGLSWAGIVTATVGDELIDRAPQDGSAAPSAGTGAPRARARELVEQMLDGAVASPREDRQRFADAVIDRMTTGLPALPRRPVGEALLTVAVWLATDSEAVVAPLQRGGLRGRTGPDPHHAGVACGFAGALVAAIGLPLTDDLGDDA